MLEETDVVSVKVHNSARTKEWHLYTCTEQSTLEVTFRTYTQEMELECRPGHRLSRGFAHCFNKNPMRVPRLDLDVSSPTPS
jgi:hypothetical protein